MASATDNDRLLMLVINYDDRYLEGQALYGLPLDVYY
jgi:hypothetical protein